MSDGQPPPAMREGVASSSSTVGNMEQPTVPDNNVMTSSGLSLDGSSDIDGCANQHVVTPDMLYKLSKKIAQLTKVIYSLNTRNDDLELDLENMRGGYEEKLQICHQQLLAANKHAQGTNGTTGGELANGTVEGDLKHVGGTSKTPDIPGTDTVDSRKELKRAKQALKQSEAKVKAMQEEIQEKKQEMERLHKDVALFKSATSPPPEEKPKGDKPHVAMLEQQVKQLGKAKQELTYRIDRLDVLNENFRLERETLKRELAEMTSDKNRLQLELSAANIELNYNREMGIASKSEEEEDKFTDDLIEKIDQLTKEKADLSKELETSKVAGVELSKQLEAAGKRDIVKKPLTSTTGQQTDDDDDDDGASSVVVRLQAEKAELQNELTRVSSSIVEDRARHEADLSRLRSETQQIQTDLLTEAERSRLELSQLAEQLQAKQADLESTRADLAAVQQQLQDIEAAAKAAQEEARAQLDQVTREREALDKEVSDCKDRELQLKVDMGQNSEKLYAVEERCRSIEKERDDLKKKCKEFEAKMDVMARSEQTAEKDTSERIKSLEKALEEALLEREEILEAAETEIQQQKTIALERDQKMMDDFEWKLREIESEYRAKMRDLEAAIESRVQEHTKAKDEEFTRMCINMRREMEDKMRVERTSLKQALDTKNAAEKSDAIGMYKLEKDREIRILQKSWEEEEVRLHREMKAMQKRIDKLPQDIEAATRTLRTECDASVRDERRKSAKAQERNQEEYDKLKDRMSGEMRRLQAECAERVNEYEAKLETAHGNRMSSMFQMKDEVESEFTERMEQLRDMYKGEMETQAEKLEEERDKARDLEKTLRQSIADQRHEIDELNAYYGQKEDEHEAKINELLTRLQDQTTIAMKLQAELDEYEWYEEDENNEEDQTKQLRPPSSRSGHHSRPASTKPTEQNKYPQSPHLSTMTTTTTTTAGTYVTAPLQTSSSEASSLPSSIGSNVSQVLMVGGPDPPPRNRGSDTSSCMPEGEEVLAKEAKEKEVAQQQYTPQVAAPMETASSSGSWSTASSTAALANHETDGTNSSSEPLARPSWHQRLLKSASGVLMPRDSQEETQQCVTSYMLQSDSVDASAAPNQESANHSNSLFSNKCNDETVEEEKAHESNNKAAPGFLPAHMLFVLSIVVVLHVMMAYL